MCYLAVCGLGLAQEDPGSEETEDPDLPVYRQPLLLDWEKLGELDDKRLAQFAAELSEATLLEGAHPYDITNPFSNVIARWTMLQPEAALDFAVKVPRAFFRRVAVDAVFYVLAQDDPEKGRRLMAEIKDPRLKELAREKMGAGQVEVAEWVEKLRVDSRPEIWKSLPNGTFEWLDEHPAEGMAIFPTLPGDLRIHALRFAKAWALKDEPAAIAWAFSQPPPIRDFALGTIFGLKVESDPERVLADLPSLPSAVRLRIGKVALSALGKKKPEAVVPTLMAFDEVERYQILKSLLEEEVSSNNPRRPDAQCDRAIERNQTLLERLTDPPTRQLVVQSMVGCLAVQPPERVRLEIRNLPEVERITLVQKLLPLMQAGQPEFAQELMESIPPTLLSGDLIQRLFNEAMGGARKDFEKGMRFALAGRSIRERESMIRQWFGLFTDNNVDDVLGRVDRLPSNLREAALQGIVERRKFAPATLLVWAEKQTGRERMELLDLALSALARSDLDAARKKLGELLADEPADSLGGLAGSAGSVTLEWAKQDPDAARTWMLSLPRKELRYSGMLRGFMVLFTQKGAADAEAWLEACPESATRDQVMVMLSKLVAQKDKELAVRLLAGVKDFEANMDELQKAARYVRAMYRQPLEPPLEKLGVPADTARRITSLPGL
ncbi:MAG: hypothetical protein QM755_13720 [Luteolibacter sp.]